MTTIQQIDESVDLVKSLLWQHDAAPIAQSLVMQKQAWYDENQTQFWTDWYRDVFNLLTANSFGLNVWAIILGLPLQVFSPPKITDPFGYGTNNQNYGHGNFANQGSGVVTLLESEARIALRLRYYKLISRCTVPEINKICADVFAPLGKVYVLDANDMTTTYVFGFTPSAALQFVLDNYDLLPRPAAVQSRYIIQSRVPFGYGPNNQNFNHGSFLPTV